MKTASWSDIEQNRPETPERFQFWEQVLSSRSFSSGRHYWEVDVSEGGRLQSRDVLSQYREGRRQSGIGSNNKSWGLWKYNSECYLLHDNKPIPYLPIPPLIESGSMWIMRPGSCPFMICVTPSDTSTPSPPPSLSPSMPGYV
ncbi:unnamed protein product [Staurois parvus]|uniref:B30.2/SPRY domain-containing protein n=1 Tax=Staurois parvus TaxID=386267 RepID=A0ABN9B2F2_9NEOB|nr:unnamed protein product [Staurois parvus]